MQIQICISLLSLKFKYSNPCKRGGGGHTQWQWPKHQLSEWVTRVNSWEGLCSFCPVHDVTSAWPFSSHYQIWLMLCFGRLMFKWGHFLLKAFYYVCFYMRTANNPRVCYAAFTVVPLSLWLYCLWLGCLWVYKGSWCIIMLLQIQTTKLKLIPFALASHGNPVHLIP